MLPVLLSVIAGMSDVIGFITFGVFTAHVTGNVVLLAALLVRGGVRPISHLLTIPVFLIAVAVVWLAARRHGSRGAALVAPLLRIHLLLFALVLAYSVGRHAAAHRDGIDGLIAALLAVTAMGCQAALSRLGVSGAPSTGAITGHLTVSVLALLDILSQREPMMPDARERLRTSLALSAGFFAGCLAGAAATSLGDWAWSLPVAVAALAVILQRDEATHAPPQHS